MAGLPPPPSHVQGPPPPPDHQIPIDFPPPPNTPLAPSVEKAYYRKCIQLKRRLNEIEAANEESRTRQVRLNRAILKMRLERAFLLEQMAKRMGGDFEGSEGGSDGGEGVGTPPRDRPHLAKRRRTSNAAPPSHALGPAPPLQPLASYPPPPALPPNVTPLPPPPPLYHGQVLANGQYGVPQPTNAPQFGTANPDGVPPPGYGMTRAPLPGPPQPYANGYAAPPQEGNRSRVGAPLGSAAFLSNSDPGPAYKGPPNGPNGRPEWDIVKQEWKSPPKKPSSRSRRGKGLEGSKRMN
nr:hypothetical protein B0A51_00875 [Rachicladosporium sp. CCFEE 5018]